MQGLEGVARLRVSTGLDVGRYGGAFHRRTADDIELPALNADQARFLPPFPAASRQHGRVRSCQRWRHPWRPHTRTPQLHCESVHQEGSIPVCVHAIPVRLHLL